MKAFVPLMLLSGLLLTGCASTDTDFSSVPGPSGGGMTAANTPAATTPVASNPATRPVVSTPAASSQAVASKPPRTQPIVTQDTSWSAKVVSFNSVGRFVVLNFPIGQNPRLDQTVFVYRNGLKVGELKITGPQRDNNIVADLVNGEARAGDEARDR